MCIHTQVVCIEACCVPISTQPRVWHMQGHYVPQLAQMIVDGNAKPGAQQLNLQGFLLGVHCCSFV